MFISYVWAVLWHERLRFFSAILAIALSATLVNFQCGVVLGIFATTSVPIDRTDANIWIGAPGIDSVDAGYSVAGGFSDVKRELQRQPSVIACAPYVLSRGLWVRPDGTRRYCTILGSEMFGAPGMFRELSPALQTTLAANPGTVVVDESTFENLGQTAELNGRKVQVVGLVEGCKGMEMPYVICSLTTARQLTTEDVTYLLVRCIAPDVAIKHLHQQYPSLSIFEASEFSTQTRFYWLVKTNGGIATLCIALISLIVGAVITTQSLYAATVACLREYAFLVALGIPHRRIGYFIMAQALGVGLAGILLSIPLTVGAGIIGALVGLSFLFPWWLFASVLVISGSMAGFAGFLTLRTLRAMKPADFLC